MSKTWNTLLRRMPTLLRQLEYARPIRVDGDLRALVRSGIYVLYENGRPLYVGKTRMMERALRGHFQSNDTLYSFAWSLAREAARHRGIDVKGQEWKTFERVVPTPERIELCRSQNARAREEEYEEEKAIVLRHTAKFRKWYRLVSHAKARVKKMQVRAVQPRGRLEKTLFPIYAQTQLGVKYQVLSLERIGHFRGL